MTFRRAALVVLACLSASCVEDPVDRPSDGTSDCSTRGQVSFVRDALQDWYYWYQELSDPDAGSFDSPEEYLEAVRYRPDRRRATATSRRRRRATPSTRTASTSASASRTSRRARRSCA